MEEIKSLATLLDTREILTPDQLHLPSSPTPRRGDKVVWYSDALRREGVLVGYDSTGAPIVNSDGGITDHLRSFDEIRWASDVARKGPIWEDMHGGLICRPLPEETDRFRELLTRRIPPGPSYLELVEEIWHRGYEVFLVGGTVRDVIAGGTGKDVDLVTSMPIQRALPLLTRMFRTQPSVDGPNGFCRLGGKPSDGDPHIDLKAFVYKEPGTEHAVFAPDFARDVAHRDFACNAIYYDPINDALLDPTGFGIANAASKCLVVVCDRTMRSPYHRATIVVRVIKFRARGWVLTDETVEIIQRDFMPDLHTMTGSNLLSYMRRQIFNKTAPVEYGNVIAALETAFEEVGAKIFWADRVLPLLTKAGLTGERQ